MKKLLAIAAVGEAGTGFVLLVYPPIVVRLLFAAEIAGAGVVMSRIAGISLIALGIPSAGSIRRYAEFVSQAALPTAHETRSAVAE